MHIYSDNIIITLTISYPKNMYHHTTSEGENTDGITTHMVSKSRGFKSLLS